MTCVPGKVTCIIGRNGVGKTTLMKNIMGIYRSDSGDIFNRDESLGGLPAYKSKEWIRIGSSRDERFFLLTVEENLRAGMQARTDKQRKVPEEIYEMFPILKDFRKRRGGDLSGGQQQQLAIGRSLAGDPSVLLLDEPTEGIQPNIIQEIGRVLRKLVTEQSMTVILVEQYLDFVKEFGDDFYIMNRGRVVSSGQTDQLDDELIREHLSV